MRIVVDEPKRRANLAKHGIDLIDASVFDWPTCVIIPARDGRTKAVGLLRGVLVEIIYRRVGT